MRTGYPSPPSLGDVDSRGAPRGAGLRHGRGRGRRAPRDTVLADTRQLCVTHTVWTVLVKGGSQAKQSLGLYGALRGQPCPGPEGPQGDASTWGGPVRQVGQGPTPRAGLPQTEGRRGSSARKGRRPRRRRGQTKARGRGAPHASGGSGRAHAHRAAAGGARAPRRPALTPPPRATAVSGPAPFRGPPLPWARPSRVAPATRP